MDFSIDKIKIISGELKKKITVKKTELFDFLYKEYEYKTSNDFPKPDKSWKSFEKNGLWGGKRNTHYLFYKKFKTGKETVFRLVTGMYGDGWGPGNPQFLVYLNGEMVYGMDYFHEFIEIAPDTEYEMYIYAYTNDSDKRLEFRGFIEEIDEAVKKLYYDLLVPYEVCAYTEETEKNYVDLLGHLKNAVNMLDLRIAPSEAFSKSVALADRYLEKHIYEKKQALSPTVSCVGHSHIDCAWLWTVKQTREKVQRTFSSVVSMMKKYPDYKFTASSAQLYEFVKEEAPELYEEIKKLVKEGRWDAEGAMWVEADCNLSGGESLVRQILFGKRFFKEEFGVDCNILWLPDVFGYSAAMPQILKKCGIDKFVTSKISWNEANTMPHDTFMWQGIDGTGILTYFMTAQDKVKGQKPVRYATYAGLLTPAMVAGTYERYSDKNINDDVLLTYGYGDGGGGPTEAMIEVGKRLEMGVEGCPKVVFSTASDFLKKLQRRLEGKSNIPKWVGELYLEFHRGTYTSMAKNKRYNRKSEFLYHNAEALSVAAGLLLNKEYPKKALNEGWKGILLNQFHDIIPGSSIKEVYEESDALYEKVINAGSGILSECYRELSEKIDTDGGILVFNSTPFKASGTVMMGDTAIFAENIPAYGYRVIEPKVANNKISVSANRIENAYYIISFKNGAISRIYDKKNKREVIKKGALANELIAYEDFPKDWDAWEITNYYKEKSWKVNDVISTEAVDYGEKTGLRITKKFLNSTIVQEICVFKNSAGIEFDTDVDWKEAHILLKAAFPIDVHTDYATYDIQFGNVKRPTHKNTDWEAAKFEVCAHKFADVSEGGYGVALLNDCKYGYDTDGTTVSLTLIKSATYPNPDADKCAHKFVYSLYPHKGDFAGSDTVCKAYLLNNPLCGIEIPKQKGSLKDEFSLVSTEEKNIVIETVKRAENGRGIIVRLYECCNIRTNARLSLGFEVKNAILCDMYENDIKKLQTKNTVVELTVKPYEIVTLRIEEQKS